jgi:heme exporter protein D
MSPNNFFIFIAMGKYNAHVLGALFVMLFLMVMEPLLLSRKRKRILSDIRKRLRARRSPEYPETPPEK